MPSDKLNALLANFSLHAEVFYAGNICGVHRFARDTVRGHLHLIKRGPAQVVGIGKETIVIGEPALVFLPRADDHRLVTDETAGAEVVCGTVQFGGGGGNPITDSLPPVLVVELASAPGLAAILALMFDEAFALHSGRQIVLDRLCEVLMVHLLRHCVDRGLTRGGTLAGLADPRLSKALAAVHADPAGDWTLPSMAALAGMSRARFAVRFHTVVGETPADYVATWRVMSAQRLLKDGHPLKHVAYDVGYGSPSAFIRVFTRKVGSPPAAWLKSQMRVAGNDASETDDQVIETDGGASDSIPD